jgi:hypothetical protein
MNTIDGHLLLQTIDPLTKDISPEYYSQFESVGQETLNLFIELKIAITSNFQRRNQNVANFLRKLDDTMPNLPTPIQNWFKDYYKCNVNQNVKTLVLEKGPLKSLDKVFSFDSLGQLMNPLNWFTDNSLPPIGVMDRKVPCGAGTIPSSANSADTASYVSTKTKIQICKERAISAAIPKISTPNKSHGQPLVGDYEFAKRMGKVATEFQAELQKIWGVNAKFVMDNINYKPSSDNIQTAAPDIKIPTKIGDKVVNSSIYGYDVKTLKAGNPFLPKKIIG